MLSLAHEATIFIFIITKVTTRRYFNTSFQKVINYIGKAI